MRVHFFKNSELFYTVSFVVIASKFSRDTACYISRRQLIYSALSGAGLEPNLPLALFRSERVYIANLFRASQIFISRP